MKGMLYYLGVYTSKDYLEYFNKFFPDLIPFDLLPLIKPFYDKKTQNVKFSSVGIKEVTSLIGSNPRSIALFTGGTDVNPIYYGDKLGKHTDISNTERDKIETAFFDLLDKPYIMKVGICRGAQFLTIMSGGQLIQHVTNHNVDHQIIFNREIFPSIDSCLSNSSHHQMMFPFVLHKNSYKILACSHKFLSDVYLNGDDEDMQLTDDFVEPEIVYYPKTQSLCIQGHPEWANATNSYQHVCMLFIEHYFTKKEVKQFEYDEII